MKTTRVFLAMAASTVLFIGAGCSQTPPSIAPVTSPMPVPTQETATPSIEETKVDNTTSQPTTDTVPTSTPTTKDTSTVAPTVPTNPTPAPTVKTFTVTGNNFAFDVKTMTVKQGDTVRITFKNAEGFHDWVLDEFNANTGRIGAGQEKTIEFVANKKGTFEYYCSVGSHRAMGMKGTLTVE